MLKTIFTILIWLALISLANDVRRIAHDVHVLASPPASAR